MKEKGTNKNKIYRLSPGQRGTYIETAIERAHDIAKAMRDLRTTVQFEFNGLTVSVNAGSDPNAICESYGRALTKGSTIKEVGP